MNKARIQWDRRAALASRDVAPPWLVAMKVAEAASYRERAQRRWRPSRTIFAVYLGLLVLVAGFAIFSAVQWERAKDAETYAAGVTIRNVELTARLAGWAAADGARDAWGRLRLLQDERPDLLHSAAFRRLRDSLRDLAQADAAPREAVFETASGGE